MKSTIRLTHLRLVGYRSWGDQEYQFAQSGVVLVKGRDLRTRTTSGVGKTSLLSAPAYALGHGPPTTATKGWGVDASLVELGVEVGGVSCVVERGTGGLVLREGDKPAKKGRVAEERLRELVGPADLLKVVTWRPQQERGNFFTRTPGERREFLAKLLDLGVFEKEAEAARRQAGISKALADTATKEVERCRSLKPAQDVIRPTEDLAQLVVAEQQARSILAALEAQDFERAREERAVAAELRHLERCQREASTKISSLDSDRRKYAGQCPTCGVATSVNEHILTFCRDGLAVLHREQEDLLVVVLAKEQLLQDLQSQAPPLQAFREVCVAARSEVDRVRAAYARYESESARQTTRYEAAQEQLQRAEVEGAKARATQATEDDLACMLRAWQAQYCAEVLADLSTATNAILAQVPNVSSVTVDFYPEEKSNGRSEVGHRVYVSGVERDDGLSGGQRSAVELAVDLAVVDVVVGRSRVVPKWMVLDEPFGGMGIRDREAFLELLLERAECLGMVYLVVDQHSREFSELFQQLGIGVEMLDGRSRIVSEEEKGSW